MKNLKFEGEISIPQAKSLFQRGTSINDDIYLIDKIIGSNLPKNKKETKCIVILICEEGKIRYEKDGHTIFAEKNDIILLNCGQTTSQYKVLTSTYQGKAILVNPEKIPMLAENFCNTNSLRKQLNESNPIKLTESERKSSAFLFLQTINYIEKQYANNFALAINQIKIILHIALGKKAFNAKNEPYPQRKFEEFTNLVDQNLLLNLPVSDYCRRLGISMTSLESIVKKYTGKSPLKYIHAHLINRICIIAECTHMSIKEIAKYAHFPNETALSRFVKRELSMSLSTYRKLKPEKQQSIIPHTILDRNAVLKALPKIYIQEYLIPLLS